jgi:EAL domain-containing protein (putative c-di-GMP-specific phosphodiesterase class I)
LPLLTQRDKRGKLQRGQFQGVIVDTKWFLETIATDGSHMKHNVGEFPFRVGRDASNHLAVAALGLSRHHAELSEDITGRLRLTDLDSTNGTFVNRNRVSGSCLLTENDIIHFGNAEYRLGTTQVGRTVLVPTNDMRTVMVPTGTTLSENFVQLEAQFLELLQGKGLSGAAQPIVNSADSSLFAYELLGRSKHPELPASPLRLFQLANALGREAALSEAFRRYGIHAIAARLKGTAVFVNTHPSETFEESFFMALRQALAEFPGLNLVVEVHETAVMETQRMRELAARLTDIGVRFAYDDFGAGQARLNELGEVPAHFVKFDMGLIRDIHLASDRKRRVVGDLVKLVHDLGSVSLAEGVETEAEAVVCRDMGFQLIQGYLTGKPVMLEAV